MADSTEELIDDKGVCSPIVYHASNSKTIQKLFECPTSYGDHDWEKWKSEELLEWWRQWKLLKNLTRCDYIKLAGNLPSLLLEADLVPAENRRSWHFQQIKNLYKGISLWVEHLTDYDDLTPKPTKDWDWCLSDAYKSKARWDLAKAVLDFQPNRFTFGFSPSAHLWFWGELGYCLRMLQNQGLVKPLPHTAIPQKQQALKVWGEFIQELKDCSQASFESIQSLKEAVNTFDGQVLVEALQGKYLKSEDEKKDPRENYIKIEDLCRTQAKNSSNYTVMASYVLPKSSEVRTYIGEKGVKRPKPPRKKKRGFVK